MIYRGYPERDLVANRSSLLLHGSTEAERRAWAEEAAATFAGQGVPLTVAPTAAELHTALSRPGVVYVPDLTQLDAGTQAEVVRVLREREERPKLILALSGQPDRARESGTLRADLQYALQIAVVNLDEPGLKDAIRIRRARAPKRPAVPAASARPSATKTVVATRSTAARPASARRASSAPARSSARSTGSAKRPAARKPAAPKRRATASKPSRPAARAGSTRAGSKGRRTTARPAAARAARRPAAAAKKKARPVAKKSVRRRR